MMTAIKSAKGSTQARCYDGPFDFYQEMAWAEFQELRWRTQRHEAYAPFATRASIGILQDDFLSNLFTEFWRCACQLMWPFRMGSIKLLGPSSTGADSES